MLGSQPDSGMAFSYTALFGHPGVMCAEAISVEPKSG